MLVEAEQRITKIGGQENVEKRLEVVYGASVLEKIFSFCDVFFANFSHPNEITEMGSVSEMIGETGITLFRLIFGGIPSNGDREQRNEENHRNTAEKESKFEQQHFHVRWELNFWVLSCLDTPLPCDFSENSFLGVVFYVENESDVIFSI